MFKRILKANAELVNKRPWWVLAAALVLTIAAGFLATKYLVIFIPARRFQLNRNIETKQFICVGGGPHL